MIYLKKYFNRKYEELPHLNSNYIGNVFCSVLSSDQQSQSSQYYLFN